MDFRWDDDFVGNSQTQRPSTRFEGEAVFVGHGIVAPEFQWNDYKDVDVTGKVLVLFTNEPASDDPKFFDGRALTYYGRWTYKYEEALRHGALACIIIHTTPTAGYGWDVVRNSWGREPPFVKLAPGEKALSFRDGSRGSRRETAGAGGEERRRAAEGERPRDFRPIAWACRSAGTCRRKCAQLETRNVAGMVRGAIRS